MYDVVVIGGGFAGATALREATAAGYRAVLLEARDRLGGRAWYKRSALGALDLEMGCQFFNTSYPYVLGEIERYGVPYEVYRGGLNGTHWIRTDGSVHEGGPPLESRHICELEDRVVELRDLAARIDLSVPWAEQFPGEEGRAWDISVDQWLSSRGSSPLVREVVSLALAPWLVSLDSERSLVYLARMVAADGGIYRYLAGDNVILDNGTTDLVEHIAADGDAEVRLGTPVLGIDQDATGVVVHTPDGDVRARAAIWAAPLSVLSHTSFSPPVDARRIEVARSRTSGEGSKVWARVRGVPVHFWGIGPVERLHSVVGVGELDDGTVLVIGFGPGKPWLDGDDTPAVEQELRRWFPEAEVVASTGYGWPSDRWTREAGPFPVPGDARRDAVLSKPDGRIFYAGSDTSLTRPGFVDGAIETGHRAVAQVSHFLGKEHLMKPAEVAQSLIDRYNAHALDAVMTLVADDLRFVDHPMGMTLDRAAFAEWLEEGFVTFPDAQLTGVRHVASGSTVVSLFTEEATHGGPLPTLDGEVPATGKRVSMPICFVLEIGDDNLIHAGETYYDVSSMLQQVS